MSLTIAVANLKGGVGKSTVTLNLACCLHRAGHKVLIVDADSQGTCQAWATVAAERQHDGPPVVGLSGPALRRDLPRVGQGFDVVVLDTPPRLGLEAKTAMLSADLVLMPVTPGAADVWALQETVAALEEARTLRPELRARAVVNRADRTTLSKLAQGALTSLGVQTLVASLGARVAFGEATLAGQGVVDYAPDSTAAEEIRALTAAVLAALQQENEHEQEGRTSEQLPAAQASGEDARGSDGGRAVHKPRNNVARGATTGSKAAKSAARAKPGAANRSRKASR